MWYGLISYFCAVFLVLVLLKNKKEKHCGFPIIKFNKFGLCFESVKRHRLELKDAKIMQVGDKVYIKRNHNFLILSNVDEIKYEEGYLYFKGKGQVRLKFKLAHMYRYFNIKIKSSNLDLESLKQQTLSEFIQKPFENENKIFSYINFLKNTLNIKVEDNKIAFGKNKYNIQYCAIYKLNGKVKKVMIK